MKASDNIMAGLALVFICHTCRLIAGVKIPMCDLEGYIELQDSPLTLSCPGHLHHSHGNPKDNLQYNPDISQDSSQENPQDASQENPQDNPQDNSQDKSQDNPHDNSQDNSQDNPQDKSQDISRNNSQNRSHDNPQDNSQDNPQDISRDNSQNRAHDNPQDNSKDIHLSPSQALDVVACCSPLSHGNGGHQWRCQMSSGPQSRTQHEPSVRHMSIHIDGEQSGQWGETCFVHNKHLVREHREHRQHRQHRSPSKYPFVGFTIKECRNREIQVKAGSDLTLTCTGLLPSTGQMVWYYTLDSVIAPIAMCVKRYPSQSWRCKYFKNRLRYHVVTTQANQTQLVIPKVTRDLHEGTAMCQRFSAVFGSQIQVSCSVFVSDYVIPECPEGTLYLAQGTELNVTCTGFKPSDSRVFWGLQSGSDKPEWLSSCNRTITSDNNNNNAADDDDAWDCDVTDVMLRFNISGAGRDSVRLIMPNVSREEHEGRVLCGRWNVGLEQFVTDTCTVHVVDYIIPQCPEGELNITQGSMLRLNCTGIEPSDHQVFWNLTRPGQPTQTLGHCDRTLPSHSNDDDDHDDYDDYDDDVDDGKQDSDIVSDISAALASTTTTTAPDSSQTDGDKSIADDENDDDAAEDDEWRCGATRREGDSVTGRGETVSVTLRVTSKSRDEGTVTCSRWVDYYQRYVPSECNIRVLEESDTSLKSVIVGSVIASLVVIFVIIVIIIVMVKRRTGRHAIL